MAQELPQADFEGQNQPLRLAVFGLFFGGLFVLSIGAGILFFKQSGGEDIQIISGGGQEGGDEIVVHVDGAVVNPGVYKLKVTSRVGEAVEAAGGLTAKADLARLNLAAKLSDGQKIYVSSLAEAGGGRSNQTKSTLININTDSEAQLDTLPGVGPVTAKKIVASRPYSSLDDLLTKKVVSKAVFEKIKDLVVY